jgi:spore maturation protein SpmB
MISALRFLRGGPNADEASAQTSSVPSRVRFLVVVPVLREGGRLGALVDHLAMVLRSHDATLALVTSAREAAERCAHPDEPDTIAEAEALAAVGRIIHFHCPDPFAVKADQLNWATLCWLKDPERAESADQTFFVVYDADSRPAVGSLHDFACSIRRRPDVSVFHQSSSFEVRGRRHARSFASWLELAVSDSGALRANRFVLGYELPRLIRSAARAQVGRGQSFAFTHVTGHGLCIRLSVLRDLPFPRRSPLEDMHYSFLLGARGVPMAPIPSLDRAAVPRSVSVQFRQLSRWFAGPGRFRSYLQDPATPKTLRSRILGVSAAAISAEWLSCAIGVAVLAVAALGGAQTATLVTAFVAVQAAQLLLAEVQLGGKDRLRVRATRFAFYPIGATLFGLAGVMGAIRLMRHQSPEGKTEGGRKADDTSLDVVGDGVK